MGRNGPVRNLNLWRTSCDTANSNLLSMNVTWLKLCCLRKAHQPGYPGRIRTEVFAPAFVRELFLTGPNPRPEDRFDRRS